MAITECYTARNPNLPASNHVYNIVTTLKKCGHTIRTVYTDNGELSLYDIFSPRPDFIVYASALYWDIINKARSLKIPIIFNFTDSATNMDVALSVHLNTAKELYVHWDTLVIPNSPKHLHLYTPIDEDVFKPVVTQDIDVSLIGTNYQFRSDYIKALNVKVIVAGGQGNSKLKIEEYANLIARSKITLCLSASEMGSMQIKGRFFEALFSGSVPLTDWNGYDLWAINNLHYFYESTVENMVARIKFLLYNKEEYKKARKAGFYHALDNLSSFNYWQTIFKKYDTLYR